MPVLKKQNKSATRSSKSSVSVSSASSVGSQGTPSDGIAGCGVAGHSAAGRLKGSRRQPVKCAVCDQNIVDGKDQALFCEENCQRWFHRYCAGVTVNHLETLSSTS